MHDHAMTAACLAGLRLYDPNTGRFLQVDPVPGGNANPYDYCNADPVNCTDLTGQWSLRRALKRVMHGVHAAYNGAIQVATLLPYAAYYANYQTGRGINRVGAKFGRPGKVAGHILALPTVPGQIAGLSGDAFFDLIKPERVDDEGIPGCILPLHGQTGFCGPRTSLPGIHRGGRRIDFSW